MRIRRITSHSLQAIAEAALIAMLVVGLMAGTAFAGKGGTGGHTKPGSGGTGTLALVLLTDANGNGAANWGDEVTFTVTSSVSQPWVQLTCYQGADWVTNQYVGFYAGYPWSQVFPLVTWKWPSGAADCSARLFDGATDATLKKLSFSVGA